MSKRSSIITMLALLALGRGSETLAVEQPLIVDETQKPMVYTLHQRAFATPPLADPLPALPASYQTGELPENRAYSSDFRPRGPSILENTQQAGVPQDTPMLLGTTVWQRLADFRSHGRVQLLTLWETGGSSVSFQAGKKGEPSLQWTSRLMNRGGATRGVLDQLLSASVAGANRGLHLGTHPSGPESAGKSVKAAEGAPGK